MKELHLLTNDAKALLLHQFIPKEIPLFLDFTVGMAKYIKDNAQTIRKKWAIGFMTFDSWLEMATITHQTISMNMRELSNSAEKFSYDLFACYPFLFTIHCLQQYCLKGHFLDPKFGVAVQVFFMNDSEKM